MTRFDFRFRTLPLSTALLLLAGCPSDDTAGDGSDTEATTGPTSTSPSTTAPSTSSPSTSSPSTTDTDPTDTDPTDTDTDPSDTDPDSSSSGEPVGCQVEPGEWAAPNWADNTTVEAAARQGLDDLSGGLMRGAEQGTKGVVVDDLEDLTTQYEAGDPSLSSIANPGFQPILDSAFAEFVDVIAAGDASLMNDANEWAPGLAGGIWEASDRGINEGGIEVRQIVEKGLFAGGAFYGHALSLTEGEIDEATIDRIAYIWGSNETHQPVDDTVDPPVLLIVHSASYGYRHGFFGPIVDALTAAKAYAADEECTAERDAALQDVFAQWELSMMARCVHYSNETAIAFSTATTEAEFAGGLHGLAECIGLFAGYYGLPDVAGGPLAGPARTITDADIDLMFAAFGVDPTDLGNSTTGEFVESVPNIEAAVEEFEGVVMDAYGVDAATIAMWRTPMEG